jgi:hypothetical protein
MTHNVYTPEDLHSIKETHVVPVTLGDKVTFALLRAIRATFDAATGYGVAMTPSKYLTRSEWS